MAPPHHFRETNRSGVTVKPHQVWQRPFVADARARVGAELSAIEDACGGEAALDAAVAEADALDAEPSLEGQLYAFLYACAALDRHAGGDGGLDGETVSRLYRRAQTILTRNGIRPGTSRVAHLYADLHAIMARVSARSGRAWSAAWRTHLAKYEGGVAPDHHAMFRQASLDLQLGLADEALARLLDAELPETPATAVTTLRLCRVRILRLTGDLDGAAELLKSVPADEASRHEALWEAACIDSQRSGSVEPQARLLRAERRARIPRRLLDLFLWSRATPSKKHMRAVPKASSLRRTDAAALDPVALRCALAIERGYEGKGSLGSRVATLGRLLEDLERIDDLGQQMLVWAAAARWLFRAKKPDLATLPLARYRALCLGLTLGREPDVLHVAGGIPLDDDTVCSLDDFRFPEPAPEPPAGLVRRNLELSRMAMAMARAGGAGLAGRALGAGAGKEQLVEYAEIAARYMGQLKGPLMKLGQILGYYGFDVPPEVTRAFATLHDASAHLSYERVRATVESELGVPIDQAFARFDHTPLATGSIGQVHAAELPDGRAVAVKVQYPDAERMIRNDLRSLSLAKPFLRLLLPRWDVDGLLGELGAGMLGECDYRREAKSQDYFRALLADEAAIHVPAPVASHTTLRVLTSERVRGLSFQDFCARATQEEKNRAGVAVVRFVLRTVMAEHSFNSDMHPGNLLFSPGRVHFLDFGNVRFWEGAGDDRGFRAMIEALLAHDLDRFRAAFRQLGMLIDDDDIDFRFLFELMVGRLLRCLVVDEPMRFEVATLREDVQMLFLEHPEVQKVVVPPRYLYFFRIYWGMFAVLAELGAEANWRRVTEQVLRELANHPRSRGITSKRP